MRRPSYSPRPWFSAAAADKLPPPTSRTTSSLDLFCPFGACQQVSRESSFASPALIATHAAPLRRRSARAGEVFMTLREVSERSACGSVARHSIPALLSRALARGLPPGRAWAEALHTTFLAPAGLASGAGCPLLLCVCVVSRVCIWRLCDDGDSERRRVDNAMARGRTDGQTRRWSQRSQPDICCSCYCCLHVSCPCCVVLAGETMHVCTW